MMRSKIVGFVKFFSEEAHADQFIASKLFMRRLRYFQQLENEDEDDGRPDATEAVVSWHQPDRVELTLNFPGFDPITIGKDDLAGPMAVTRHFYADMHVFCLTALSILNPALLQGGHDDILAQLQAAFRVDDRCLDFGPYAVLVTYKPFITQLRKALEGCEHWYNADLVIYYDEKTFHGTFDETKVPFMKQSRFAYQNEYRICMQTPTAGDDPLIFEIGDMSSFAHKIWSADLNARLQVTLKYPSP